MCKLITLWAIAFYISNATAMQDSQEIVMKNNQKNSEYSVPEILKNYYENDEYNFEIFPQDILNKIEQEISSLDKKDQRNAFSFA